MDEELKRFLEKPFYFTTWFETAFPDLVQLSRAEALVASVNQDGIRGREEITVDAWRLYQY